MLLSKRFSSMTVMGVSVLSFFWLQPAVAATSASNLVQVSGVVAGDQLGRMQTSGDLNGDGRQDLIIAAPYATVDGSQTGAVYIIYGTRNSLTDQNSNEDNVVVYAGENLSDWAGFSGATADLDGDGFDDLIISASQNSDGAATGGSVYVIYGASDHLSGGSLAGQIELTGSQALEYLGYAVAGLGDVDGDGFDDMAVGGPYYNGAVADMGEVLLVYGSATRLTSGVLSAVATQFTGETSNNNLGSSMSAAGDINNDGYDDWVMGAYGYGNDDEGATYVVYGSATRPTAGSVSQFVRLSGESDYDAVGSFSAPAGDLNADGFDDVLIGVPSADYSGSSEIGFLYIIYGSNSALTSQALSFTPKIIGAAASDYFGYNPSAGDTDGDGYPELLVGAPYNDESGLSAGLAYLVDGQAEEFETASISALSATSFSGEAAADLFGQGTFLADMNGDGFDEVVAGAPYSDTNANLAGAVYLGYLRIDIDGDGVLADSGMLEAGTDCNDRDETVSAEQTYFLDEDGDGLGVDDSTTTVCSSTAPNGFADNDNDTNDSVKNNGIEIDGDGVDNDGDDEIDEVNTIAENGRHPEYKSIDPLNKSAVNQAILKVKSTPHGKLRVRYADNSVYVYTIFPGGILNPLKLKRHPETGYYVAMLSTGRKVALVNVLKGKVRDRAKVSTDAYRRHDLQFSDLLNDGQQDLIIASKIDFTVRLSVLEVNLDDKVFKHKQSLTVEAKEAKVHQTTVVGDTIDIRSATLPLFSILVDEAHELTVAD